jgi:hypothetical protein
VSTVVFRKLIGRAMLENVQQKTGKSAVMLSPDGSHMQQLDGQPIVSPGWCCRPVPRRMGRAPAPLRRSVTVGERSFYVALLPWQFENQPRCCSPWPHRETARCATSARR